MYLLPYFYIQHICVLIHKVQLLAQYIVTCVFSPCCHLCIFTGNWHTMLLMCQLIFYFFCWLQVTFFGLCENSSCCMLMKHGLFCMYIFNLYNFKVILSSVNEYTAISACCVHTVSRLTVSHEPTDSQVCGGIPHSSCFLWLRWLRTGDVFVKSLGGGGWWLLLIVFLQAVSDPVSKVYNRS